MLTPNEAFRKFRSSLELTQKEQDSASSRQKEIRALMDESFNIADDFLTGSYRRWTKTKPLKDVDIFCIFHDDERPRYRNGKAPSIVLGDVENVLTKKYGHANVSRQRRAVTVEFTDSADEERVMSFDVVPAFTKSHHYEIPDTGTKEGWTETNPKIHFDKAKDANDAFNGEWKGMVRMAKSWNRTKDKIIKPSFLIEVMALQVLRPPFGGVHGLLRHDGRPRRRGLARARRARAAGQRFDGRDGARGGQDGAHRRPSYGARGDPAFARRPQRRRAAKIP
jgi:Second Messenger Oligonucleotide or Dinucleotide Synthetase domain